MGTVRQKSLLSGLSFLVFHLSTLPAGCLIHRNQPNAPFVLLLRVTEKLQILYIIDGARDYKMTPLMVISFYRQGGRLLMSSGGRRHECDMNEDNFFGVWNERC